MEMNEHKIQWSIFSPDRTQQYVIRVDTYEELETLRELVLKDIPQRPFPNDVGPIAISPEDGQEEVPHCAIHKTPMKFIPAGTSKSTGKPYPAFWSCGNKENGKYCSYRPKL